MVTAIALLAIVVRHQFVRRDPLPLLAFIYGARESVLAVMGSDNGIIFGRPLVCPRLLTGALELMTLRRLMANAHNTIHRLERYVTRALTRTISDVYLNISEIRTIVIEIRTVLTDLQDSIAIPITQIGPIHDAIIPMHTQQLPAFERRLNSIALQADARRFAADLRQKLNTATDPQIIELMDRIVQPHAKLHIAGRDGTHYPNYQELRDAVLHGQVDPDDLREGLAAWLEGILAL
ncbi:hypothetical protein JB92DRAFT_3092950 [Gautieria morchelliformis]|nr:hypothetical protein JB92DRAFT_3092950 [Gautieria morchelliformis]